MAQLVLSRVGAVVGSRLLPRGLSVLGRQITGAAIGGTLGSVAGSAIDARWLTPPREGPRLRDFHVMESREGASIPIVYGRVRLGGQVIWAAEFKERRTMRSGGKVGPRVREYAYSANFAVGLCEGEIARVSRCWANGEPFDLSKVTWRLYPGTEGQAPDPLIEAIEGAGNAPAYRGQAYIVFEDLPLDAFGARLPQFSFEVMRPMAGGEDRLERVARGVNLIPGAGEFVLATDVVRRLIGPGREQAENLHGPDAVADLIASLDQLEAELPNARRVNLVVSWFGDDLRCGNCRIRPGVDRAQKQTQPWSWDVAGRTRATAHVVSQTGGRANYGGTPSDRSVVQAIRDLKARGFHVTLYPFVLMDVPAGNARPDPYGGAEQSRFPWRGRITCHPAPGRPGSPDGTAAAAAQVAAFFGGTEGYRAFILHCADLATEAGGVDGFLIGTELVGLTRVRGAGGAYPAVEALRSIASEVRARIGSDAELSYAADWTEYGAHILGNGDVAFPLDDLWADTALSHVAVDWYPPMGDWRDGGAHADAGAGGPRDRAYLAASIAGGEAFDWYYVDAAGRAAQDRLPITDGAFGEPWVFRQKDIRSWWGNAHHPRTGGARATQPTAWVPGMKPVRFAEFGCPAVDKGANQPNVFYDPKSSESALPHFSGGARDDLIQRRATEAFCAFWSAPQNNPLSTVYAGRMVPEDGVCLWAWDARPFPAFPARDDVWGDGENWRLGHWLNGRVGAALLGDVIADLCGKSGVATDAGGDLGLVPGYRVDGPVSVRAALEPLLLGAGISVAEVGEALSFRSHPGEARLIDPAVLVPVEDDGAQIEEMSGMEELGASVRLAFSDSEAEHAPAVRLAEGAPGAAVRDVELALTLDPDQAAARAEGLREDVEAQRFRKRFALAGEGLAFEPGDTVELAGQRLRIRAMTLSERMEIEAGPAGGASRALMAGTIPMRAPPQAVMVQPDVVIVDAPPLPGEETDARPIAFAFSEPWAGPVRLSVEGDAEERGPRGEVLRPCRMGRLAGPLFPAASGRWLDAEMWVALHGLDLASETDSRVLQGANAALVETGAGWELIQFARADQVGPETWRLRRLLRGQQGAEPEMAAGAVAGARVAFLDGAQARLDVAEWERGLPMTWRAWREAPEDAEAVTLGHVHFARALRPWSPAHLRADWSDAGLSMSWIRRGRFGGDAWGAGEPPLEGAERYRVQAMSGGVTRREWVSLAPALLYPRAEVLADFPGGGSLTIQVAQIGSDEVPGAYAARTVAIPQN